MKQLFAISVVCTNYETFGYFLLPCLVVVTDEFPFFSEKQDNFKNNPNGSFEQMEAQVRSKSLMDSHKPRGRPNKRSTTIQCKFQSAPTGDRSKSKRSDPFKNQSFPRTAPLSTVLLQQWRVSLIQASEIRAELWIGMARSENICN